jgi:hypothetical protein
LKATTQDAQTLVDAYVAPLGQSLTYSLNSGWASSAKTHKKLGFDITFGAPHQVFQMQQSHLQLLI